MKTTESEVRKREKKKSNTYKHIIKLALKEVSLCMPFFALNTALIYSSHYHICSTQTHRSGHTKTMSSIQMSSTSTDISADMFTVSLLYLSRPKPGTSADYLNYLQWLLARELNMAEKLSQGYWKSNPSLCKFNMFWRLFPTIFKYFFHLKFLTWRILTFPKTFSCDIAWMACSLSVLPSGMKILSWEKARLPIE